MSRNTSDTKEPSRLIPPPSSRADLLEKSQLRQTKLPEVRKAEIPQTLLLPIPLPIPSKILAAKEKKSVAALKLDQSIIRAGLHLNTARAISTRITKSKDQNIKFLKAIEKGDLNQIQELLKANKEIEITGKPSVINKEQAFNKALECNRFAIAQLIIDSIILEIPSQRTPSQKKLKPKLQEQLNQTKITVSKVIENNTADTALFILTEAQIEGRKLNWSNDKNRDSPLHMVIKNNKYTQQEKVNLIKCIVEINPNSLACKNSQGTALHLAMKNGDYQLSSLLITRGANINARNSTKEKPVDLIPKEFKDNKKWQYLTKILPTIPEEKPSPTITNPELKKAQEKYGAYLQSKTNISNNGRQ